MSNVLIVDDDQGILTALKRALLYEGFNVRTAMGGVDALKEVETESPDVMVLDINMPDLDGVSVTRILRNSGYEWPICILSANDEIADRVLGLEAGADDYMVKPFALPELIARLHALLRRVKNPMDEVTDVISIDSIKIHPASRQTYIGSQEVELTKREFDLLMVLALNEGIVQSRFELLEKVWGYDFEVESNVVDVFIGYLRKKLNNNDHPDLIQTVRGIGFVLRK